MPEQAIIIDSELLKSTVYTLGFFIFVLFGVIWKILFFVFNRFESNIKETIKTCHSGLDDYAKDTRKKVDKIDRWTADHIENHHT